MRKEIKSWGWNILFYTWSVWVQEGGMWKASNFDAVAFVVEKSINIASMDEATPFEK